MSKTDAALTYLFVPGNRPERVAKALASGADRVIIDLEDAVPLAEKGSARQAVAQLLADLPTLDAVLLRINHAGTPWYTDDLTLAVRYGVSVMLPKCESAAQVAAVQTAFGASAQPHVLPLIESARGLVAVHAIAAAAGVQRLAFGTLDYMAELDIAPGFALDWAATQIALASCAAGLPPALAGVTPELDPAQVEADMRHARTLGLGAKMCIHPGQIAAVRAALQPSDQELAWAQRVQQASAAAGGAAVQLDGRMVDRPVLLKAERILARA